MSLHLTADDVARCEAASRVLLSPLASASVDDWRRSVNQAVRELFRADKTIFMLPKGERLFYSEDAPSLAAGVEDYVTAYTTTDGIQLSDVIVDLWNQLRRNEGLEVFTWDVNDSMIGRHGFSILESEMVSGVLRAQGVADFTGCYVNTPLGEVLLWMLFDRKDKHRFGEHSAALLRALLPSFKAGLDTLIRIDAQRQVMDLLSDAIVVFGVDRCEMHRNQALIALYDADPEFDRIRVEVSNLAMGLCLLGFPGPGGAAGNPFTPSIRRVTTNKAQYDLKGTLLPAGAFGSDPSVMIVVSRRGGAELPTASELCERYGITARESEVALLLAKGHPNDQIAAMLFLSPHTVRRHTANLFDKLGVNTRKALALKFLAD